MMRLNDFLSERNVKARYYNIIARLDHVAEADRDLLSDILSVPGEQDGAYFCVTRMALWVSGQEETAEFRDRGGFAGLDLNKWAIAQSDGRYRIRAYLYGLQEEKFDEFCRLLGADPAKYYNTDNIRAWRTVRHLYTQMRSITSRKQICPILICSFPRGRS